MSSPRVKALFDLLRQHGYMPAFTLVDGVVTLRVPWPTEGRDDLFIKYHDSNDEEAQYECLRSAAETLGLIANESGEAV